MTPGMKMLLMANRDREQERGQENRYGNREYETTRNEHNGSDMNYGVEGRFRPDGQLEYHRDRQMNPSANYDVDGRFRDRQGRERYDDGRFAPMRNNYEPENDYNRRGNERGEMHYPSPYTVPPYRAENENRRGEKRPMGRIGFALEPEHTPGEVESEYRSTAEYPHANELERNRSREGGTEQPKPLDLYIVRDRMAEYRQKHNGHNGESEFLQAVEGKDSTKVWEIIDELMRSLKIVNPKVYDSVLRKVQKLD